MVDPNQHLNDLLGTLPNLADLAELYWKAASHEVMHIVHRAASDVIQSVQPDHPLGSDITKLDVPARFSWRRE